MAVGKYGFAAGIIFFCLAATISMPAVVAANPPQMPDVPDVPEEARAVDAFDADQPRVENRLLIDAEQVRPGDTVDVGVLFKIEPEWHIYWRHAGQGGMSTEVLFDVDGGTAGSVMWPEPTVYHEAGGRIITFGYGQWVLFFTEVEVDEDASGQIEVRGAVDYLVCKVDCIPGDAELRRSVPVGDDRLAPDEATARLFELSRQALPRSAGETGIDVEVRYSQVPIEAGDEFRVEISAVGCVDDGDPQCTVFADPPQRGADAFVFDGIETISLEVARVVEHPEVESGWFVELRGRASRDQPGGDKNLTGVLRLRGADGRRLPVEVEELFPREDSEEAQALLAGVAGPGAEVQVGEGDAEIPGEAPGSLLYFLLLAFIGGMLLNLMPCVFPVLAIKVFAFVNLVHEKRGHIYSHSAAYTGGIVGSMLVLAGVVVGLQMLGTRVGWGFQFQEPWFIAAVGAVIVLFALNLFGVFEVTFNPGRLQNVGDGPLSHRRSFGEGVLAVVLATPCSAPFLGTAVGFALVNPPWVIASIFAVLGLGLAAPFVVLTLIPGAAKYLPRPGEWMTHFKHFLGFALLATAIWLVWLIGQISGANAVIRMLILFLAIGVGAWIFGIVQYRSHSARRVGTVFAIAVVAVTGYFILGFDDLDEEADPADRRVDEAATSWQVWSEEAVQSELASGRAVFVNFTADWCITCKVNEANVLVDHAVVEAVEEYDVALFVADWTRRDDVIRDKLAEFGKAGVPLYLVYSPDPSQKPKVLPELLTRQMVVSALHEANSSRASATSP